MAEAEFESRQSGSGAFAFNCHTMLSPQILTLIIILNSFILMFIEHTYYILDIVDLEIDMVLPFQIL